MGYIYVLLLLVPLQGFSGVMYELSITESIMYE